MFLRTPALGPVFHSALISWLSLCSLVSGSPPPVRHDTLPPLRFLKDTLAFANQTVFIYPHGYAEERPQGPGDKGAADYTLRCFAMCRTVEQFHKFARFDPALPPPDDTALATLIRRVTHRAVWKDPLPFEHRVIIPGYAGLYALSLAREQIVKQCIGGGWSVFLRPGNFRMLPFFLNGSSQQAYTWQRLENALARNDLFTAYLTTFPSLSILHAVLIYGHQPSTPAEVGRGIRHYLVYDPNHPGESRDMIYNERRRAFSYQKDWDFVGGNVTVLQVYSYFGQ
jgi:hypothetical protein